MARRPATRRSGAGGPGRPLGRLVALAGVVSGLAGLAGLSACGSDTAAVTPPAGTVANVGELPVDLAAGGAGTRATTSTNNDTTTSTNNDTTTTTTTSSSTTGAATTAPDTAGAVMTEPATTADGTSTSASLRQTPLGDDADGNRILVIGDSITESLLPRYGGELCARLEDRGWYVGADAVNGRDAAQGLDALQRRWDDGDWDAAIVNLGTNYRNDAAAFDATMRRILRLIGDRPVLLVTVTEWEADVAEANYVIRSLADDRDNVRLVDWADRTEVSDELTGGDGIHLSDTGRAVLTNLLVRAVGDAPGAGQTGCRQYGAAAQTGGGD